MTETLKRGCVKCGGSATSDYAYGCDHAEWQDLVPEPEVFDTVSASGERHWVALEPGCPPQHAYSGHRDGRYCGALHPTREGAIALYRERYAIGVFVDSLFRKLTGWAKEGELLRAEPIPDFEPLEDSGKCSGWVNVAEPAPRECQRCGGAVHPSERCGCCGVRYTVSPHAKAWETWTYNAKDLREAALNPITIEGRYESSAEFMEAFGKVRGDANDRVLSYLSARFPAADDDDEPAEPRPLRVGDRVHHEYYGTDMRVTKVLDGACRVRDDEHDEEFTTGSSWLTLIDDEGEA